MKGMQRYSRLAAAAAIGAALAAGVPCAFAEDVSSSEAAQAVESGSGGAYSAEEAAKSAQEAASKDQRASRGIYPVDVEKSRIPTLAKEVGEERDGAVSYGAHADTGAAKALPFRLTGTLPDNYGDWPYYYYKFTDTAGAGIALDKSTVKVWWVHEGESHEIAEGFKVKGSASKIEVEFKDLKKAVPKAEADDEIVVGYEGRASASAKRYGQDNGLTNKAVLEYDDDNASGGHGTTEPASTESYTYRLRVLKTDRESSEALSGARFTLTDDATGLYVKADGTEAEEASELSTGAAGELTFRHIDAGSYTLTETASPDGYELDSEPKKVDIASNAAEMGDALELSATADGGAQVVSVSANAGLVEVAVGDEALPEGAEGRGPTWWSPFSKTGDWLMAHPWAAAAAAAAAAALAWAGTRLLRKRRAGTTGPRSGAPHGAGRPRL